MPLFCHVGRNDFSDVVQLKTWKEAIKAATSIAWENLCLEASNQLRERILAKDKARFKQWNATVDVVKPLVEAHVDNRFRELDEEAQKSARSIADNVKWDLLHLAMECEHLDIIEPGFFHALSFYYSMGHFPCGFRGTFPQGKQIVF